MTDAEDRKPQSDEARSAFRPPSGVAAPADGESSTTSEFAVPEGLAVPRTGPSESEVTSEFALPRG
ncbi:threonine/serine exporter family protein, partial [Streptomyces sp. TRM76130]|nr:threonine/serine exporter family protein [Streptomyces sp. TRM76130]